MMIQPQLYDDQVGDDINVSIYSDDDDFIRDSEIYEVQKPVKLTSQKSKRTNTTSSRFKALGFGKEDFDYHQPISKNPS
jgi:hypothetical protein